jgi:UDP-glucuronate 4-epimerase
VTTYLVTGAAGFIGSKVCELLLADNHTVIAVDNLNDAYDVRLKHHRLRRLCGRERFCFHRLDIRDRAALRSLVAGLSSPPAAILNLAARAGVRQSVEDPWVYFETNTTGTLNLLELCRDYGIEKFVLSSTSSLYGLSDCMPYREDADTNRPLSPYAASKKAAEVLCYTYHDLYGIDVTVLRYFTVYGPAGRPDMSLFRFVHWISGGKPVVVFGDGGSRDFTFVEDVARGTIAGLRCLGYEIINLGSDTPIAVVDAIKLIEQRLDKRAHIEHHPRHAADVPATWADIGKARRLLGWEPRTAFTDGVDRLATWYERNAEWLSEIAV